MVGHDTVARSWTTLKKSGILISLLMPPSAQDAAAHGVRAAFFVVSPDTDQLNRLGELIDAGTIHPVLSSILPLKEAHWGYERRPNGTKPGKLVLQVVE